jgi:hypothetical protein
MDRLLKNKRSWNMKYFYFLCNDFSIFKTAKNNPPPTFTHNRINKAWSRGGAEDISVCWKPLEGQVLICIQVLEGSPGKHKALPWEAKEPHFFPGPSYRGTSFRMAMKLNIYFSRDRKSI